MPLHLSFRVTITFIIHSEVNYHSFTHLKLALICELLFAHPLYLHVSVKSRKSYIRIRESFDVTSIYKYN